MIGCNSKFMRIASFDSENGQELSQSFSKKNLTDLSPATLDSSRDFSPCSSKRVQKQLVTLFIDSEKYNDIYSERSKHRIFTCIEINSLWDVKLKKSTDVRTYGSEELDEKFRNHQIDDAYMFCRKGSDQRFKSLDQVVKEYFKKQQNPRQQKEKRNIQPPRPVLNFLENSLVMSDNEDEALNATRNHLYFLESDAIDTSGELVLKTRKRAKPVF